MIGISNPRCPVCPGCEREVPDDCMSCLVPGVCALCAIPLLAAEQLERALDFQALSAEWFEPADKHAFLEDLDETVQAEADAEHAFDVRDALYSANHPYEPRVA